MTGGRVGPGTIVMAGDINDGEVIETELLVVGAGPAGLVVAEEMSGLGVEVLSVESGLDATDTQAAKLNQGTCDGIDYSLSESRARGTGGSTNAWDLRVLETTGARYRALDPEDFEANHVRGLGWPISAIDLEAYYRKARVRVGLSPELPQVDVDETSRSLLHGPLVPSIFEFGPSHAFHPGSTKHSTWKLLVGATALQLERSPSFNGRVSRVRCGEFGGRVFWIAPKVIVLAGGGIEIPKLMLASVSGADRFEVGNEFGFVGRYFMEHWHLWSGVAEIPRWAQLSPPTTEFASRSGSIVRNKFAIDPKLRDELGIMNAVAMLTEPERSERLAYAHFLNGNSLGTEDAREAIRRPVLLTRWSAKKAAWHSYARRASRTRGREGWRLVEIYLFSEQEPSLLNRVELADNVDALGHRLMDPVSRSARLTWNMADADIHTLRRAHAIVAGELRRVGARRVSGRYNGNSIPSGLGGGFHHMGTTRMSTSPMRGVVDTNLRVHGHPNLFVAGSAVFPTSGYANPTLTIIAMSYKLADHLATILRPYRLTHRPSDPESHPNSPNL